MLKKLSFFIFMWLIFICFSFSFTSAKQFSAIIYKVSDGDTVWVKKYSGKKIKLRLLGIDTPEKFESKKLFKDCYKCNVKPKKMKYLGKLATNYAKKLLHKGERVTIVTYGKGYYKRTLAMIILPDGKNFNFEMVKNGYACVYRYKGHKYRELSQNDFDLLVNLEKKAASNHIGLWDDYFSIMRCLCQ